VVRRQRLWRGAAVVALAPRVWSRGRWPRAAPPDGVRRSRSPAISGDRVELWGNDLSAPLRVDPASRRHRVPFQDYWHHGDRYVVPGDACSRNR
jgi:hypothetical protein